MIDVNPTHAKIVGPQRMLKHPAALTTPAVEEQAMAEKQSTHAHSAPQGRPLLVDLTRMKFNRLTAIRHVGLSRWLCVCDCGAETTASGVQLRSGRHKSCGCAHYSTHGMTHHPLFSIWTGMIQRCHNPKSTSYPRYGARGILVCERWRNSPQAFFDDIGPRPSAEYSLERCDNSKGYEPGNVRWATIGEQCRNRRSNVMLTARGKTQCLDDWAKELGMTYAALHSRIYALGWDAEKAIFTPVRKRSAPLSQEQVDAVKALLASGRSRRSVAMEFGVCPSVIKTISRRVG